MPKINLVYWFHVCVVYFGYTDWEGGQHPKVLKEQHSQAYSGCELFRTTFTLVKNTHLHGRVILDALRVWRQDYTSMKWKYYWKIHAQTERCSETESLFNVNLRILCFELIPCISIYWKCKSIHELYSVGI